MHKISRMAIDRAGNALRQDSRDPDGLALLASLRSGLASHMPSLGDRLTKLAGPNCLISSRLKRTQTIIRKLSRFPNMNLSGMADIIGFRVVCESPSRAAAAADLIARDLEGKTKDYVAEPQPTGYRAQHIIFPFSCAINDVIVRLRVEIQVRTTAQNHWANQSELGGETCKEGRGDEALHERLRALSCDYAKREHIHPEWRQREYPESPTNRQYVLLWQPGEALWQTFERHESDLATQDLSQREQSHQSQKSTPLLAYAQGGPGGLILSHPAVIGSSFMAIGAPSWPDRVGA